MHMDVELLIPGVQRCQHSWARGQVFWVSQEFQQRLGRGGKQDV